MFLTTVASEAVAARQAVRLGHRGHLLALAALLAVALGIDARALHAGPSYDEGVYLASLDSLRSGESIGRDVFTSQPPGFYVLLQLVGAVAGSSVDALRIGFALVALAGVVGAWLIGRELGGSWAGLAAAGIYAAAPAVAAGAAVVSADEPAVALAVLALGVFAVASRTNRPRHALLAGALAGAALSVKLLALPLLVAAAGFALVGADRVRRLLLAACGAGAVACSLAVAYRRDLPEIWDDAVVFQTGHGMHVGANWTVLRGIFDVHAPFIWIAVAAVALFPLAARRIEIAGIWLSVAASVAFLLTRPAVLEHHRVLAVAAIALAVGATFSRLSPPFALSALALVVAAGLAQQWIRLDSSKPTPDYQTWAAVQLQERTGPSELVGTDVPIIAYLARRRVPADLVDTSLVRFARNYLTDDEVLRQLDASRVRVLVVGRAFIHRPKLMSGIERRYRIVAARPEISVYARR